MQHESDLEKMASEAPFREDEVLTLAPGEEIVDGQYRIRELLIPAPPAELRDEVLPEEGSK